jgi:two-component system, NtrC family, sensor histidine kinase HydH
MSSFIRQLKGAPEAAPAADAAVRARVDALFDQRYDAWLRRVDRLLAALMIVQWVASIVFAAFFSPYTWAGKTSVVHSHVFAAVIIGGAISSLPVALAYLQPGKLSTRLVMAAAQAMWSALLIHLTGGRIETHFHVFGSLAILAFYRDKWVLVPATLVAAADHFVRGLYWPESVYGVMNPEWWRFLEHAFWVGFIDVFLVMNCSRSYAELREICRQQVELSDAKDEKMARMAKLAAVGQLAASIGHELRNPLAAVRNARAFVEKSLHKGAAPVDPRVDQFLDLMKRELDASARIIDGLLDFARAREPHRVPCPLRPLVDEALSVIRNPRSIEIANEVEADLPVPHVDRDQIRQVVINLVQNAVEAMDGVEAGRVSVSAASDDGGCTLIVRDNGVGIPADQQARVFEPLVSSKTKGTGLGLAIVSSVVERHGGTIRLRSASREGTEFTIELPRGDVEPAAAE